MKKYDFYEDPGHGWLKVSKADLEHLGIAEKITPYSYMRGAYAYLEEDCDASTFVEALRKAGDTRKFQEMIVEHSANKMSKIRSYESYQAEDKDRRIQEAYDQATAGHYDKPPFRGEVTDVKELVQEKVKAEFDNEVPDTEDEDTELGNGGEEIRDLPEDDWREER